MREPSVWRLVLLLVAALSLAGLSLWLDFLNVTARVGFQEWGRLMSYAMFPEIAATLLVGVVTAYILGKRAGYALMSGILLALPIEILAEMQSPWFNQLINRLAGA
ncbi:MAG: hypothetical protein JRM77_04795 [Nitrososphaerota archaeon]|nr:hypothetical protein [Nitrososphaerota archaeon]